MLLEWTDTAIVAVTMDGDGAVIVERGVAPHRTYAEPAERVSRPGPATRSSPRSHWPWRPGGPTR